MFALVILFQHFVMIIFYTVNGILRQ